MPALLAAADPSESPAPRTAASPGAPLDPWCLTDPESRDYWRRDPQAQQAVANLWRYDPDPQRTLALQADIDSALARGDIVYARDASGRRLGHYFCCPWSPIYEVRRAVTIGGSLLQPLQEFTLDISAEEALEGGPFKRELVMGPFRATGEVDYCDPQAGGHRD